MIKLVSFFGAVTPLFEELNRQARDYAATLGVAFLWVPQQPYDAQDVIAHLNQADAGIINIEPYGEALFSQLNDRCKLLVRFGVGYDNVDLAAASRYGICCTRTTGSNKTGVAELALALMLSARRRLPYHQQSVLDGSWGKQAGGELIGGKVGILGFGQIGRQLARLLKGFDCEILVYNRSQDPALAAELGVRYASLEEIFSTCDAISVHLPAGPETNGLIGAKYLSMMKPEAVIVNTARGSILDEDALFQALRDHKIAGAGLDVYTQEPYTDYARLQGLDNLVLTPHVASQTRESLWQTYKKTIDITADFFAGKPLGPGDLLNPDYKDAGER